MANISSTMTIGLVDNVSKPARTVAQALKEAERAAEQVAKGMEGTGATDRLTASLGRLKAGAKDIETVAAAWRDYSKSAGLAANSADWTKTQAAGVRQWEASTLSALRTVKREQVAFNRSLAAGGGVSPMVAGMSSFGAGGIARMREAREGQAIAAGMSAAGAVAAAEAEAAAQAKNAARGRGAKARAARAETAGASIVPLGGGLLPMVGAYGAYELGAHAVHAGTDYQHERVALENAGRTPFDMREIEARAREAAAQVPTSTYTENLKTINETTGAFGDLHHALENLTFMAKAASILKNAAGDKIQADAGEIGNKFARFFEMRGTAGNTETFQREAGEMVRPMVFTRGNFNPDEMLNFAQQAKSSLQNYDLRFMSKILPSLVTEIGGERSGTAANAFTNVILGKVRDKTQTKAWEKYGLINPKDVIEGKGGALSWKAGAVYDTDMALRDPLRYMEERQLPALQKGGVNIDDPLELTKIFNQLYRNSNANLMANLVGQLRNRQRLHKDERNIEQAGTTDQIYDRNVTSDPTVAVTKFHAAWENLGASITMALPIAESLNKLAELIASAPEKVKPIVDAAKAGVDLAKDVLDNSPLAKAEREAREQAAKEGRKATVGEIGARAWDNIKESWTPSQVQAAPDYAGSDWRREKDIRRKIYEEPRGPSSSARITAPTFASRSFGAGGAPSAPALGFGGGIAASAGMPSFLRMQPYKPMLDISGLKAEAAQGEQLGDAMREKLSFTAIPTVDTSTFEKAKEGAEEVRTGLEGLNMTVSPSVDASSIDAAHAKLRAFLSDLAKAGAEARALHSHAAASTHGLDGLLGRTSRGAFQAGGGRGVD